jgi:hypothetical protein
MRYLVEKPGFPLARKMAASALMATALLAFGAVYVVNTHVRRYAEARLASDLAQAGGVLAPLRRLHQDALLREAHGLAQRPDIARAVAAGDARAVSALLARRRGKPTLAFAATPEGVILGSSPVPGVTDPSAAVPQVRGAAAGGAYSGLWRCGGAVCELAVVPVRGERGTPAGAIGVAQPMDPAYLTSLSEAMGSSLALVCGSVVVQSGWDLSAAELGEVLWADGPVRLPRRRTLARALPMLGTGEAVPAMLIVGVDASASDALVAVVNRLVLAGAVVAAAVAVGVNLMTAGRIMRPLRACTRRLGDIRSLGDLTRRLDIPPDPELHEFAKSYNAIAEEVEHLHKALRDSHFAVLWALVDALEMKDPYTGGHARRVCELALELGGAVGLSEEEIANLRLGALLHDVGKIGLPDSVLTKPGSLTDEEFDAVRQHPVWGASILRHAGHLLDLLPVILHHHERYDGNGYPEGLAGERVPLLARIIAVADAYDAMTSDRSYRPRMSSEEGLRRIREGAGTQFDPRLAHLFCELRCRRVGSGDEGLQRVA